MVRRLDQLRTFLAAYRTGSFTAAADVVGLSQPSVTAQVRALEESLGYTLFERSAGGIRPTDRAAALARATAEHLDALEPVLLDGSELAGGPRRFSVGAPADYWASVVAPRLGGRLIGFQLQVRTGLAGDLLDALGDGEVDLAISTIRPRRQLLEFAALGDEEFYLVAAPRWAGTVIDEVPVLAYAPDLPIIRRYWWECFGRRPSPLQPALVVPDLRALRDAVIGGAGMSVLPDYLVSDALAEERLVELHVPAVRPLNTLYLVTRKGAVQRDAPLAALHDALLVLARERSD